MPAYQNSSERRGSSRGTAGDGVDLTPFDRRFEVLHLQCWEDAPLSLNVEVKEYGYSVNGQWCPTGRVEKTLLTIDGESVFECRPSFDYLIDLAERDLCLDWGEEGIEDWMIHRINKWIEKLQTTN